MGAPGVAVGSTAAVQQRGCVHAVLAATTAAGSIRVACMHMSTPRTRAAGACDADHPTRRGCSESGSRII
eukprot:359983-Chlamydomonas_euryale.AAC.5